MGRKYEYAEWLQFECEGVELSKELEKLGEKFGERAIEVATAFLHAQYGPELGRHGITYNDDALIWNTYASVVGHGVGLWEEDGETGLPPELEGKLDKIVTKDKKLVSLADQIQGECAGLKQDAGVEERKGLKAADFPDFFDAIESAVEKMGATHQDTRMGHNVSVFIPWGDGTFEQKTLFFKNGLWHWPARGKEVKKLPDYAARIDQAWIDQQRARVPYLRYGAESPRGAGPLQEEARRPKSPFDETRLARQRVYEVLWQDPEYVRLQEHKDIALHEWNQLDAYKNHPRLAEPEKLARAVARSDAAMKAVNDYEDAALARAGVGYAGRESREGREPLQAGDLHTTYRGVPIDRTVSGDPGNRSAEYYALGHYFASLQDAKRYIDGARETPQGGEPLGATESTKKMSRYEVEHAAKDAAHAKVESMMTPKPDHGYVPPDREELETYLDSRRGGRFDELVDSGVDVVKRRHMVTRGTIWPILDRRQVGWYEAAYRAELREQLNNAIDRLITKKSPRVGQPSHRSSEAREASSIHREGDAVPWVRITRDPKLYEEGIKRAKEIGPIDSGRQIYELLSPALSEENQEVFLVVLCNLRQECIGVAEVHRGERSRVSVSRADILQVVTKSGADHFHVVHNHPSGDPTPSPADRKLTEAIQDGAAEVEIPCVDHVVIGMGKFYSFAEGKVTSVR